MTRASIDSTAERDIDSLTEVVRSIRNARAEAKVEPAKYIEAFIVSEDSLFRAEDHADAIVNLARVRPLHVIGKEDRPPAEDQAKVLVLRDVRVILPLAGMVDLEAEKERLLQEIKASEEYIARVEKKLANEQFTTKAPDHVVERERSNLAEAQGKLERLQKQLQELR